AVDQLGRRHAAQKMQRMGLAGEVAARRTGTATVQIGLVLQADLLGVAGQPLAEPSRIFGKVAGQASSCLQLAAQILHCAATRDIAVRLLEQGEIQIPRRGWLHERNRSNVGWKTSGQLHNSYTRQWESPSTDIGRLS